MTGDQHGSGWQWLSQQDGAIFTFLFKGPKRVHKGQRKLGSLARSSYHSDCGYCAESSRTEPVQPEGPSDARPLCSLRRADNNDNNADHCGEDGHQR